MNTGIHLIFFSQRRQAPQIKTQTNLIPLIKMILFSMSSMYLSTSASISTRWRNKWRCDTKLKKKKIKNKDQEKVSFPHKLSPFPYRLLPRSLLLSGLRLRFLSDRSLLRLKLRFLIGRSRLLAPNPLLPSSPRHGLLSFLSCKKFNQHQDHYDWRILSERSKKAIKVYPGNMYFNELFHWQTTTVNECIYI